MPENGETPFIDYRGHPQHPLAGISAARLDQATSTPNM
jgi:hypothetical protein